MRTTVLTALGDFPVDLATIAASPGSFPQGAPAVASAAATLTPAQLLSGIISTVPVAAINLQLPTVAALEAALAASRGGSVFPVGQGFDLSVINTSAGAFAATLTTNTGWTLAGSMSVGQNVSGYFVAAKTAAGAWTLYRGS
jgi:hypothetical protein